MTKNGPKKAFSKIFCYPAQIGQDAARSGSGRPIGTPDAVTPAWLAPPGAGGEGEDPLPLLPLLRPLRSQLHSSAVRPHNLF